MKDPKNRLRHEPLWICVDKITDINGSKLLPTILLMLYLITLTTFFFFDQIQFESILLLVSDAQKVRIEYPDSKTMLKKHLLKHLCKCKCTGKRFNVALCHRNVYKPGREHGSIFPDKHKEAIKNLIWNFDPRSCISVENC